MSDVFQGFSSLRFLGLGFRVTGHETLEVGPREWGYVWAPHFRGAPLKIALLLQTS